MSDYSNALILPMAEYRIPIYEAWDKTGYPCPKHPDGWMAYHEVLLMEEAIQQAELIITSRRAMIDQREGGPPQNTGNSRCQITELVP